MPDRKKAAGKGKTAARPAKKPAKPGKTATKKPAKKAVGKTVAQGHIMFKLPVAMKTKLTAKAKAQGVNVSALIRTQMLGEFGYAE